MSKPEILNFIAPKRNILSWSKCLKYIHKTTEENCIPCTHNTMANAVEKCMCRFAIQFSPLSYEIYPIRGLILVQHTFTKYLPNVINALNCIFRNIETVPICSYTNFLVYSVLSPFPNFVSVDPPKRSNFSEKNC